VNGKTWRERNPEAFNAAWRAWYRKNAKRKIAWQSRRRDDLREWLKQLKSTLRCNRCGEDALECLQFHHRDPSVKDRDLSSGLVQGWPRRRMEAEIAKCEVLCANCHLKHHWAERRFL
jgi:hypothetical protein